MNTKASPVAVNLHRASDLQKSIASRHNQINSVLERLFMKHNLSRQGKTMSDDSLNIKPSFEIDATPDFEFDFEVGEQHGQSPSLDLENPVQEPSKSPEPVFEDIPNINQLEFEHALNDFKNLYLMFKNRVLGEMKNMSERIEVVEQVKPVEITQPQEENNDLILEKISLLTQRMDSVSEYVTREEFNELTDRVEIVEDKMESLAARLEKLSILPLKQSIVPRSVTMRDSFFTPRDRKLALRPVPILIEEEEQKEEEEEEGYVSKRFEELRSSFVEMDKDIDLTSPPEVDLFDQVWNSVYEKAQEEEENLPEH
ncbi:hypothetical protein PCE1_002485 [Barthelona sp. PCE]